MKTKLVHVGIILALTTFLSLAPSVFAVEGGMQRPISGMQIAPFAGVIPPEPGFDVVVSEIRHESSACKWNLNCGRGQRCPRRKHRLSENRSTAIHHPL